MSVTSGAALQRAQAAIQSFSQKVVRRNLVPAQVGLGTGVGILVSQTGAYLSS
jgi:hypothetical protein